ncbi:MAG: carboxypeptidase-like regulatory domain-containing protein [Gemmatimonadales bacterium]
MNPSARRFAVALLGWLIGASGGAELGAQVAVRGRVMADSGARPVVAAEIVLDSGGVVARTDSLGRFALAGVVAGPLRVVVRAIGYRPAPLELEVPSMGVLEVTVRLTGEAQALDPLEVRGEAPPAAGKLLDFERRRRFGIGSFLTRAELAEKERLRLSDVVRGLRGVVLVPRPWRCGGGFAVTTSRAHYVPKSACAEPWDGYRRGCYLSIYVDGIRRYDTSDPDPPNVDDFLTERVEAIELYRGPGELPAELSGTGTICGALVIWTRISGSDDPGRP